MSDELTIIIIGTPSVSYTRYISVNDIIDPDEILPKQKKESLFSNLSLSKPYAMVDLEGYVPKIFLDTLEHKKIHIKDKVVNHYSRYDDDGRKSLEKFRNAQNEHYRKTGKYDPMKRGSRS